MQCYNNGRPRELPRAKIEPVLGAHPDNMMAQSSVSHGGQGVRFKPLRDMLDDFESVE
jgi:hypothetical protein